MHNALLTLGTGNPITPMLHGGLFLCKFQHSRYHYRFNGSSYFNTTLINSASYYNGSTSTAWIKSFQELPRGTGPHTLLPLYRSESFIRNIRGSNPETGCLDLIIDCRGTEVTKAFEGNGTGQRIFGFKKKLLKIQTSPKSTDAVQL